MLLVTCQRRDKRKGGTSNSKVKLSYLIRERYVTVHLIYPGQKERKGLTFSLLNIISSDSLCSVSILVTEGISIMHQSFVSTAPPPTGMGVGIVTFHFSEPWYKPSHVGTS